MRTLKTNRFLIISLICVFILLSSGCGFIQTNLKNADSDQQPSTDGTNQTQSQNSQVTPVQPNEVNAEIAFDVVDYVPSDFKPRPKGGIYVYTKEAHAGAISDYFRFDWDKKDVLYIQLGDFYKGYKIEPLSLEKKDAKTLRLVLRVLSTDKVGHSDAAPARVFLKVPKGSLSGYSFEVVDEQGKEIPLQ